MKNKSSQIFPWKVLRINKRYQEGEKMLSFYHRLIIVWRCLPELLVMIASGTSIQVEYMLSWKKYWRKTFYSSATPPKKEWSDSKRLLKAKYIPQAFYFLMDQPNYPTLGFKKPHVSVICFSIEDIKHPKIQEEWSRGGREQAPTYFVFSVPPCRALPPHVSFVWRGIPSHTAFCQSTSVWSSEENGPSGPEFLSLSIPSI